MKIASVVVNRNDGYKDFERGLIHFKSMIRAFDEVNYVDWNSPNGSFIWEIEDNLPKTGKIKHYCIPSEVVDRLIFDKKQIMAFGTLAQDLIRYCENYLKHPEVDHLVVQEGSQDGYSSKDYRKLEDNAITLSNQLKKSKDSIKN